LRKDLKNFLDEVDFGLRYLEFLISINDDANARALFEKTVTTFSPEKARPVWDRWAKYEYQFGNLEACHKMEKRMAEIYPNDPPIKRFAARHKYLTTDVIAVRDMGFTFGSQSSNGSSSSQNTPHIPQKDPQMQAQGSPAKRPPSPDYHKGRGDHGPPSKRLRPASPPRERDRWDSHPTNKRRFESPAGWDRDRDRDTPRRAEKEEKEEKPFTLPEVLSSFIGMLPSPASFDGPIFRTDDLLQVFRNAVIASSSAARSRSPPPVPRGGGGGRPPPDYSPYTGPGGGRRSGVRY